MLVLLIAVLGSQIVLSIREGYHEHEDDNADSDATEPSVARGLGSLLLGMLMLVIGAGDRLGSGRIGNALGSQPTHHWLDNCCGWYITA